MPITLSAFQLLLGPESFCILLLLTPYPGMDVTVSRRASLERIFNVVSALGYMWRLMILM